MNIYEMEVQGHLWWVSAEDEAQAAEFLVEELYSREISDEEIDEVMEELFITQLNPKEAEAVDIVDEYSESMYTLWDMFIRHRGIAGLLHTNFSPNEGPLYIDEDTYMGFTCPWDEHENF